jgi:uncharacterized membrane protein
MKDIRILLFSVLCFTMTVWALVPKTQAYTLKTMYSVEIHEDGTASWMIAQSAYLQTSDDQTSFKQLINRAMVYIDQFASNVSAIINQAYSRTGRFMTAEHITVGGNVTESDVGAYGFLTYSFDWTNFASAGNTNIAIGDAFSNESFMFGQGEFSILLPTGYHVESCSPPPDYSSNDLLGWSAVSDFRDGQPAILLSKAPPVIVVLSPENKTYSVNNVSLNFTVSGQVSWEEYSLDGSGNVTIAGNTTLTNLSDGSHTLTVYCNDTVGNMGCSPVVLFTVAATEGTDFLSAFPVLLDVLLAITGAVLASVLVLRVRKKKGESTLKTVCDEIVKEVGDRERILALLKNGGGQALQSRITEQLKFSKAKTSRILADMEDKGIIKRYKRGREKVVSIRNGTEKTGS